MRLATKKGGRQPRAGHAKQDKEKMDVLEAIEKRHSVRKYCDKMPDKKDLIKVMEAARLAPTAVNKQPFRLICATTPHLMSQLQASYDREWFKTAPAIIVVVANHAKSWHRGYDGKDHADIDVAIATDHMTLRATELGLGTCWVCNFDPAAARKALNLTADEEPVALLPIGYAAADEPTKPKSRKTAQETYSFA